MCESFNQLKLTFQRVARKKAEVVVEQKLIVSERKTEDTVNNKVAGEFPPPRMIVDTSKTTRGY